MASEVIVRVRGRGVVIGGVPAEDDSVTAACDLCGSEADATASVALSGEAPFACKNCLRARLEAMTVSLYLFSSPAPGGLPWGKISG
ncbi:MAG TPA: hypothetical protein PKA88_34650 [Polyangiaceae bacterium]|nr:hypothetical protein [Polyangiaceae bacterium]